MFDVGRKLSVGDCALFQAANTHPYIGFLRKVTQEKETTKFIVNWLYRPADVKLAKGGPLEAAPNEIFYSFHKDEISAASLLHPCKVAFLRKGTDLPQGVSSFVCRRVYDTANKCLWWLTDRDYTDEHQDEVDQLLEKTKLEMQAAVHSGGPSPRSALIGGPTSSQQLKTCGSDGLQNATYCASNKSKKRERADQNLEPSKRERSARSEDGELSSSKRERSMKPEEIASITDKDGGLLNQDGVKVLVQLMQQDRNDGVRKSTDVSSRRTMLAAVVAATERDECLSRFVSLGGLPMLDDWLQEAHKGKVGDVGSPKEGDKGVEELLLTLLKALDKLPVDLDALKTCSVGKSVNHLRSHKNIEIQKKARKLVDIWKKRVDAEMKLSGEVKPGGSNSNLWNNSYKQNSPDLHSHLMKSGGPTEVAVKSSGASAGSAKPMPSSINPGEVISNGPSPAPGGKISTSLASSSLSVVKREENVSNKLTNGPVKEEYVPTSVKEERNGGSLPLGNGQAWSNGSQSKSVTGSTLKEDVKNASMGGPICSKSLGTGSRHPSMNGKGLLGAGLSGSSKDSLSGKPLVWSRTPVPDKLSSSTAPASEKGSAEVSRDVSNPQHRLIVRIPNPGRSPARSGGGSEQSAPGSRVMSPNVPERSSSVSLDASDSKSRGQNGNATSPDVSADMKNGRHVTVVDDEKDKNSSSVQSDVQAEGEKREETMRGSESGRNLKESNEHNGVNGGFAPRNSTSDCALVSEDARMVEIGSRTNGPSLNAAGSEAIAMDVDDLGISLLASVAASEIRTAASDVTQEKRQPEVAKTEQDISARVSSDSTSSHLIEAGPGQQAAKEGDDVERPEFKASEDVLTKGRDESNAMPIGEGSTGQPCDADLKKEGQQERLYLGGEGGVKDREKRHFAAQDGGHKLETFNNGGLTKTPLDRKGEDIHVGVAETESAPLPAGSTKPFSKDLKSSVNGGADGSAISQGGHYVTKNESLDERKTPGLGKGVELCNGHASPAVELKNSHTGGPAEGAQERLDRSYSVRSSGTGDVDMDISRCLGGTGERNDRKVSISVAEAVEAAYDGAQELKRRAMDIGALGSFPSFQSAPRLGLSDVASSTNLSAVLVKPAPRTLPAGEPTTPEQATETAGPSDGVVGGCDVSERPDFDLNEGLSVEESPQDYSTTSPVAPAPVVAASAPGQSSLLTAPIAIVTATKGGFVLPASPMRSKSELGWKGSAATSAFRPAEPRRTPDRQASAAGDSLAPEASTGSTSKKGRPPLDLNIDLNVSDDRTFEDLGIAGAGAASSLSSQGSGIGMGAQVRPYSVSVSGITFQSDYSSSGQQQPGGGHHSASGRPILDLNMLDESEESGTLIDADMRVSQHQVMAPTSKSNNSSSSQAVRRVSVVRDFDLNDGPMADEPVPEDQQPPVVQPSIPRSRGPSMIPGPAHGRGPEVVHSSWFAPNSTFKPAMPEYSSRAEYSFSVAAAVAAQSYLNGGTGSAPFNADMYRTNVALPSVPPTAYPSANQGGPYHYGGFAVANGFPFSTGGSFTPSNVPPYLDSSGSVFPVSAPGAGSSHLPRPPYLVGLSSGGPSDNGNGGWSARPSLDLNAGPEPADGDGTRDDLMSSRPTSMLGGPPLDQMRVFRPAAGPSVNASPLKRKEPDSGWNSGMPDMNRSSGFKQQAWR